MPMDFPDMESLEMAGRVHKFRKPNEGEHEMEYRDALADHVFPWSSIESHEIRTGRGWDKWTDAEKKDMLNRQGFPLK